jgi:tetratricopeptide (TPR) repeat protein
VVKIDFLISKESLSFLNELNEQNKKTLKIIKQHLEKYFNKDKGFYIGSNIKMFKNIEEPTYRIRINDDIRLIFSYIKKDKGLIPIIKYIGFRKDIYEKYKRKYYPEWNFELEKIEIEKHINSVKKQEIVVDLIPEEGYLKVPLNEIEEALKNIDPYLCLDREQEKVVNENYKKLVLVKGGPGTGKTTLVLRKAFLTISKQNGININNIKIVTLSEELRDLYNSILNKYTKSIRNEKKDDKKFNNFSFSFNSLIYNLKSEGLFNNLQFENYKTLEVAVKNKVERNNFLKNNLNTDEKRIVLDYINNKKSKKNFSYTYDNDFDDYLKENNFNMKKQVFDNLNNHLKKYLSEIQNDQLDRDLEILKYLKSHNIKTNNNNLKFFVDESQDFSEVQLEIIKRLSELNPNNELKLFVAGDIHQKVTKSTFNWEDLFLEESHGNKLFVELKKSYRFSNNIKKFREEVLKKLPQEKGIKDGALDKIEVINKVKGIKPIMTIVDENKFVRSLLEISKDQKNLVGQIMIFSDEKDKELLDEIENETEKFMVVSSKDVKGLETDSIIIYRPFKNKKKLKKEEWNNLNVMLSRAQNNILIINTKEDYDYFSKHISKDDLYLYEKKFENAFNEFYSNRSNIITNYSFRVMFLNRFNKFFKKYKQGKGNEKTLKEYLSKLIEYELFNVYANAMVELGKYKSAIDTFIKIEEYDKALKVSEKNKLYMETFEIYYDYLKNYEKAIEIFESNLKDSDNIDQIKEKVKNAYLKTKNYLNASYYEDNHDEKIKILQKGNHFKQIAILEKENQNYDSALRYYLKSEKLSNEDYINIANIYFLKNDFKNANNYYKKSKPLKNSDRLKQELLEINSLY